MHQVGKGSWKDHKVGKFFAIQNFSTKRRFQLTFPTKRGPKFFQLTFFNFELFQLKIFELTHFQNSWKRNENEQLKNDLSEKAIQVEQMLQQAQQADTQRDLQLNEQVAQNAQLQHRVEVLQEQIRTRGNFNFL